MKEIRKQIKEGVYHRVYLLFGDDSYRITQAKEMLKKALVAEGDEMNYQAFTSTPPEPAALLDYLMTFPFLAKKRVVILDSTNIIMAWKDALPKILEEIPDSAVLIICENNVDKRGKAYKWIKKNAFVREYQKKDLDETDYASFVGLILKKAGKKITRNDAIMMVRKIGTDMFFLKNETDKLIAYVGEREFITRTDIEESVPYKVSDKIFAMVDAVAEKNKNKVMLCYQDLILLRESPLRILSMLTRQYRILLKIYDLSRQNMPGDEIMKNAGIRFSFVFDKSMRQLRSYDEQTLITCLDSCLEMEEMIKSGKINDRIGVETMLISLSQKE